MFCFRLALKFESFYHLLNIQILYNKKKILRWYISGWSIWYRMKRNVCLCPCWSWPRVLNQHRIDCKACLTLFKFYSFFHTRGWEFRHTEIISYFQCSEHVLSRRDMRNQNKNDYLQKPWIECIETWLS